MAEIEPALTFRVPVRIEVAIDFPGDKESLGTLTFDDLYAAAAQKVRDLLPPALANYATVTARVMAGDPGLIQSDRLATPGIPADPPKGPVAGDVVYTSDEEFEYVFDGLGPTYDPGEFEIVADSGDAYIVTRAADKDAILRQAVHDNGKRRAWRAV